MTLNDEVHEAVVDGVPALWLEAPRPFTASLSFRVGLFDEQLRIRGLTHLTEHLALSAVRDYDLHFNGSVTPHVTTFHAGGEPEAVGGFLGAVCRSLHDLPIERLDVEREVLRRESEMKQVFTFSNAILNQYFGVQGPGLFNHGEVGLSWIGPEEVRHWASQYFTRANAILTFTGPPPNDWELPLPEGLRRPVPALDRSSTPAPDEPTLLGHQYEGVTWGALVNLPRGIFQPALLVSLSVLARRLQDRLRHDLGRVYSVGQSYLRIDRELVFLYLAVDSSPEHSRQVGTEFLETLKSFAESGPTADEILRDQASYMRQLDDFPDFTLRSHLESEAVGDLCGWERYGSLRYGMDGISADSSNTVRERFAEAYRQSFIVADLPDGTLPLVKGRPRSAIEGRDYRRKPANKDGRYRRIRIGPDGIAFSEAGDGSWSITLLEDIELVSFVDEFIVVYSDFATSVIDTSEFFGGKKMAEAFRALVSPEQILPSDRTAEG